MVSLASSSPSWQYSYAPHNRRVWRGVWTGSTLTTDEVTFWAGSRKLGTWALSWSSTQLIATMTSSEYYFAGRLIKNNTGYVASDRLGSIGKFYPWGQEKPSATTNGTEKFTGYYRDLETGNDYAVNRYHQPGMGRFLTADPSGKSMVPGNPGSWNRYAYVLGDPINGRDLTGMDSGLTEEYCSSYYGMNDPGCQAGDYCEGFKACEPGSAGGDSGGGDGSGVCSSDTLGALAGAVEECVDPAPPPPPVQPQPDCTIEVFTRGVTGTLGLAQHTYIEITDTGNANPDSNFDNIIEGVPSNPHNAFRHRRTSWGNLNVVTEATAGAPYAGGTNPATNAELGSITGPGTCGDVGTLQLAVANYDLSPQVGYALFPNGTTTFNSNSTTFTLLSDIGVAADFTPVIGWSPGWGLMVPNLQAPF